MSSLPPAPTTPSATTATQKLVNGRQALGVRFGADRTAVEQDEATGNATLHLKMPVLAGDPEFALLESGAVSTDGAFMLAHSAETIAGACVLPVDSGASPNHLTEVSHQIYESVFRILGRTPHARLYRVWNFVPFINRETAGMEHYRQFNVGRWEAFRAMFGDACKPHMPAATAVGINDSALAVMFVAGVEPVTYIENPEQIPAYDYPDEYGPRPPSFSRGAVVAGRHHHSAFLSGTASVKGHQTVACDCLKSQIDTTIDNIGIVRSSLGVPEHPETIRWRAWIRKASDLESVRSGLHENLLGCPDNTLTIIQADICRAPLQVEVEGEFRWSAGGQPRKTLGT